MKSVRQIVLKSAVALGVLACGASAQEPKDSKIAAPPKAESGAGEKEARPAGVGRALSAQHPAAVAAQERAAAMQQVEDELRARLRSYEVESQKLREEMRAANGNRPVEGLREAVGAIQQDATRLRIDFAGMEARKLVIEKAIGQAREEADKRAARTDVVSGQLVELVKLLEESAKRTESMVQTGNAPPAEADKARVELTEARVKLLERQQSVLRESGGMDVSKLTDQLTNVSASLIETQARLRAMDEVLTTYERLQRLMDQEQEVRWQVGKLRGMIEHVERVRLDERLGVTRRGAAE